MSMAPDIAIQVEVTISDELKRLLTFAAAGIRMLDAGVPVALPVEEDFPSTETADWTMLCIRRDGQRPLVFWGVPAFTTTRATDAQPGRSAQTLALYLARDRTVVASLAFEPAETTPARPAYHCRAIQNRADFVAFLNEWQPELTFDTACQALTKQPHDHSAGHLAVRSAFTSMTADCLSQGVLQG